MSLSSSPSQQQQQQSVKSEANEEYYRKHYAFSKKITTSFASFFQTTSDLFTLDGEFIRKASTLPEPWSSTETQPENVVSALVYYRTYSRDSEPWYQCVQRVVEGTFRIIQRQFAFCGKYFDHAEMRVIAERMYHKMFTTKFLPPGRGLWAMGTPIIEKAGLVASLNNCSFITTENMDKDPTEPFLFLMDVTMLGVGTGADLKGAGKAAVYAPVSSDSDCSSGSLFVIEDSREGWVKSVRVLMNSYFVQGSQAVFFDYSGIREAGVKLKTFGGISGGADPLKKLHKDIRDVLNKYIGSTLDSRGIADIFNLIGVAVVSGNIRRTAEILFGDANDNDFLNLKNYDINPERAAWGWTSNNSIMATVGMSYETIIHNVIRNGEPGFLWLENARAYSRMCDKPDYKDALVCGANPCNEQSLESNELCCLVETFPDKHDTLEDFIDTLELAFLYAKTVTLIPTHWHKTNEIINRNRRIGTSISGIAQFLSRHSIEEFRVWCEDGYTALKRFDVKWSEWFGVNLSKKITTIKPSGTVSLIAGATPGMHYPISNYYIRRIVLSNTSIFVKILQDAGYYVEPSAYSKDTSSVVEIPVCVGKNVRKQHEVSMWEQMALAAFLQRYWSDNQVSATVTFNPLTEGDQLVPALNYYQYQLKGVSFLPNTQSSSEYHLTMTEDQFNMIWVGKNLQDDLTNIASWRVSSSSAAAAAYPFDQVSSPTTSAFAGVGTGSKQQQHQNTVEVIVVFEDWVSAARIDSIVTTWRGHRFVNIITKVKTPYPQMPYEPISEREYLQRIRNVKPVKWVKEERMSNNNSAQKSIPSGVMFCDGDQCMVLGEQ